MVHQMNIYSYMVSHEYGVSQFQYIQYINCSGVTLLSQKRPSLVTK